jgi:hypothetical protein
MHLSTSLSHISRSIKRVGRTHYPGFIFGLPLERGKIPVFVYHDVEADSFAADLTFLRNNGYRTLTTDEFVKQNNKYDSRRSVLLTFDDARRNFWEVTFPLLCEFKARATLFVPTYWIGGRKKSVDGKEEALPDDNAFMTWDQLRTCLDSGLVDVQSHAHRHTLIYKSTQLIGFVSPSLLAQYDIFEWPMRRDGDDEILGHPPLGTPIYEATPLLSAHAHAIENQSAVRACQEMVAMAEGKEFFARPDWANQLRKAHLKYTDRTTRPIWMDKDAFQSLVASEFLLSRELFEAELGMPPRYFAYPWMLGSILSLKLAAEADIVAVFGVGLDFHRIRRLKGPVTAHSRIKGDWLRFLPGQGRQRLGQMIPKKLKFFFSPQHLAH